MKIEVIKINEGYAQASRDRKKVLSTISLRDLYKLDIYTGIAIKDSNKTVNTVQWYKNGIHFGTSESIITDEEDNTLIITPKEGEPIEVEIVGWE